MKLVLIGTDHRLQQSIVRDETNTCWVARNGGHRYRRLIIHCIEKIGVKAILEEAHEKQESIAPTLASTIAKERNLIWQALALGAPDLSDGLFDPPFSELFRSRIKPRMLAGIYDLEKQRVREDFMRELIADALWEHDCVLAIVGYVHVGVLARRFEAEDVSVAALLFTDALSVDENKS